MTRIPLNTIIIAFFSMMSCVTTALNAQGVESFRIISIPEEETGYSNFDSIVINSKVDLDAFLARNASQQEMGWNHWADFEAAIKRVEIDFRTESLVLLRHTEGSVSTQVKFQSPQMRKKRIICRIERKEFEEGSLGAMAFYCFALVVSKSSVTEVELQIADGQPLVLSVNE